MKTRSEHLMSIHALIHAAGEFPAEINRQHRPGKAVLRYPAGQMETKFLKRLVQKRTAALRQLKQVLKTEMLEKKKAREELKAYDERLRFLASELSLSEERQRRRIASTLHNHMGQNLAAAKIQLEGLRKKADPALASQLKDVQGLIEQSIEDTRGIIVELSPPVLYELGLVPALQWLAENTRIKYGIAADFAGNGRPVIDRDEQALLFQMARELVWNAVKHARAGKIRISMRSDSEKIQLAVEDDGIGFDLSDSGQSLKADGFGLFSIRERLRSFGGNLRMESAPGEGTRATIEFQIKEKF